MLKIGVSACFFHKDASRLIFKGKTLLYLVEDVGHWLLRQGALPYVIPTLPIDSKIELASIVQDLDGLVLQGGSDVAPQNYAETPLKAEFAGDAIRDQYEISLLREFMAQHKPVLGLCRGLQLINVAFGGSLYQNIPLQKPSETVHRNWEIYDKNFHHIEIQPGSGLAALYPGVQAAKVNSVHYQAVKTLGKGLRQEALSKPDGVIEAIRLDSPQYVVGVQWHPEFQETADKTLLNSTPLIQEFLTRAEQRKSL